MKRYEYGSDCHYVIFDNDNDNKRIALPSNAIYFGCGRYAISHLIEKHFSMGLWKTIYIPAYFCYEVVEAIKKTGIDIKFYNDYPLANDEAIISNHFFVEGDVLVRMNYFGMRGYRDNSRIQIPVIEDHSHDLFSNWALQSNADWCVASLRKSLPIPDGGVLWSPQNHQNISPIPLTNEHRLLSQARLDAMVSKYNYLEGINFINKKDFLLKFRETETALTINAISNISDISLNILKNISSDIVNERNDNFRYMISLLNLRRVKILNSNNYVNPFSLVLIFETNHDRNSVRNYLIRNNIYPAILWSINNVNSINEIIGFSEKMLSVHIDFRYTYDDIVKMSNIINSSIQNLDNEF